MRGGCAPLVCDDKVGRTFCNFCSLLRRVLRSVARTLAWMCILCRSVLRGHRKPLVSHSVHSKLDCCECPFPTVSSNFPIISVIVLLTCPPPITTIIPSTSPYHPQNHPSFPSFHPLCYPLSYTIHYTIHLPYHNINYTIHHAIHLPHYSIELPYSIIHYTHHPSTHDAIHQNTYLLVIGI